MEAQVISTGCPPLDATIRGLRWGDNVVVQVGDLCEYERLALLFVDETIAAGHTCIYLRFAPHEPLLSARQGLTILQVDPGAGFDRFSAQIHRIIEEQGERAFYVFDNLSALVEPWATDELLANFFRVTCPYLHELQTVAWFALTRGSHADNVVARVADTTQVLIDVYQVEGQTYVHPIKVAGRYAPDMYVPHRIDGQEWVPILQSENRRTAAHAEWPEGATRAQASIAPWDSVPARLVQFRQAGGSTAVRKEAGALKSELRRMLMGDEPAFSGLADRYFTVDDLLGMRERLVGSGRIGGKAAGMLLARRILCTRDPDDSVDWHTVLEDHDSFYIGSDVFFTFLVNNGLFRRRLEIHRQSEWTREGYEALVDQFQGGRLPSTVEETLRTMLQYYGRHPIIARSSSFLEDGFGHAFAGKYRSEFCPNQGSLEDRLRGLVDAVMRVYASALSPDALIYRQRHGLGAADERMAILVQRVSGRAYKQYFFPTLAGVAFSRNLYPWTSRIDPAQGVVRLVFGLGTRAVDRVDDYPRMVALSHPALRPETGPGVARYSQRSVDLIDVAANACITLPLETVLAERDYPGLHLYVSEMREGHPYDPPANLIRCEARDLVLTFNNVLRRTPLIAVLREMLRKLEKAYGRPVDVEFTARVDVTGDVRINVLQCRPMSLPGAAQGDIPALLADDRVLFRAQRMAGAGHVEGIRYIVYVDPLRYSEVSIAIKRALGRLVGRLNHDERLRNGPIMLMGPGRWGSSNIDLGVNVTYADIDRAAVLVEIAREEAGQLPEVSFGTHFFQDLVEAKTIYVPVYPDDGASAYQADFFEKASSVLLDLYPEAVECADVLKVIDVCREASGSLAHVAADPEAHRLVCYLE